MYRQMDPFLRIKNTLSSSRITPLSGFSIPAMHLSVMLLPQPEAPNSPNTSFSAVNFTFSRKSPHFFSISTYKAIIFSTTSPLLIPHPVIHQENGEKGNSHDNSYPVIGQTAVTALHCRVDCHRHGLCLSWNISG